MKVTRNEPAPVTPPPPTFTLELTEREAQSLRAIALLDITIPEALRSDYCHVDSAVAKALLKDIALALRGEGVASK